MQKKALCPSGRFWRNANETTACTAVSDRPPPSWGLIGGDLVIKGEARVISTTGARRLFREMSDLRVETMVRRKNDLKVDWKEFVRLMQMVHSCQTYVGLSDVISGDYNKQPWWGGSFEIEGLWGGKVRKCSLIKEFMLENIAWHGLHSKLGKFDISSGKVEGGEAWQWEEIFSLIRFYNRFANPLTKLSNQLQNKKHQSAKLWYPPPVPSIVL